MSEVAVPLLIARMPSYRTVSPFTVAVPAPEIASAAVKVSAPPFALNPYIPCPFEPETVPAALTEIPPPPVWLANMPCVAPVTSCTETLRLLELSELLPLLNAATPAFAAPATLPVATTPKEPVPSFFAQIPNSPPEADTAVIFRSAPLASL